MTTTEKERSIDIKICSIEETHIENNWGGKDLSGLTEETLVFQYKVNAVINHTKGTIAIIVSIRYRLQNVTLFQAESKMVFNISSLSELITYDKTNNTITFSFDIMPILINTSYGTLRGIVYKEAKNTPMEKYPLPLMSTGVLVEKCVFTVEE